MLVSVLSHFVSPFTSLRCLFPFNFPIYFFHYLFEWQYFLFMFLIFCSSFPSIMCYFPINFCLVLFIFHFYQILPIHVPHVLFPIHISYMLFPFTSLICCSIHFYHVVFHSCVLCLLPIIFSHIVFLKYFNLSDSSITTMKALISTLESHVLKCSFWAWKLLINCD